MPTMMVLEARIRNIGAFALEADKERSPHSPSPSEIILPHFTESFTSALPYVASSSKRAITCKTPVFPPGRSLGKVTFASPSSLVVTGLPIGKIPKVLFTKNLTATSLTGLSSAVTNTLQVLTLSTT